MEHVLTIENVRNTINKWKKKAIPLVTSQLWGFYTMGTHH